MLTVPVTTPHFQSNVQAILSTYYSKHLEKKISPGSLPAPIVPALSPADTHLAPHDFINQLLAVTSSWTDLTSTDDAIAGVSRQVFDLEVAYASFCGIANVIVPGPCLPNGTVSTAGLTQYASAIRHALEVSPYLNLQILLPMYPGKVAAGPGGSDGHLSRFSLTLSSPSIEANGSDEWATWEAWNVIRTTCNYSSRLSVALVVPAHLPPPVLQSRWYSEPLKLLVFPESTFVPNRVSQPVLQRPHQQLLSRYMRLKTIPWVLLSDVPPPAPPEPAFRPNNISKEDWATYNLPVSPHLAYFRKLQRTQPLKRPIERFGQGYQDYLQMPLQPLADNLESITYEVFERDPVKYQWYERAISFALLEWQAKRKSSSSPSGDIVIAVVGSGRGPLVTKALHAADVANIKVQVWAIEKNPNAYVLLQRKNAEEWNNRVTVVKTDMRAWKGPQLPDGSFGHVDILVSELLGSFADNELSPECLDGVQHVMNPKDGISIPCDYTAFMTPVFTPRLHHDIDSRERFASESNNFELPWVVMLHAYDFLSFALKDGSLAENDPLQHEPVEPALSQKTPLVLPCWTFKHPIETHTLAQSALRKGSSAAGGGGGPCGGDGANAHNIRFAKLDFPCPKRGVCHGIAGYFEATLYPAPEKDEDGEAVELSTNPITMDDMSKDMISWFPIFFPLKVMGS
jgi:protein arginine N-methyltransferase 5